MTRKTLTAMMMAGFLMTSAGAMAGQGNEGRPRPVRGPSPVEVLHENGKALGVDGWTVATADAIMAAARPEMARLRAALRDAHKALHEGEGSVEAVKAARAALESRRAEAVAEIEGLVPAASRAAFRALLEEETRG